MAGAQGGLQQQAGVRERDGRRLGEAGDLQAAVGALWAKAACVCLQAVSFGGRWSLEAAEAARACLRAGGSVCRLQLEAGRDGGHRLVVALG